MSILLLNRSKLYQQNSLDMRIIKLDWGNLIRIPKPKQYTINMDSFPYKTVKAMEMASLVVFKMDWSIKSSELTVIKFRYPSEDLDVYLDLLENFPIFDHETNRKEYDWIKPIIR